jgi:lipid II:glycine glycyltransferase (peptidoglycan interpeptide bridge formation enzyme)
MESELRNVIRKAEKLGITVQPCSPDTVYELSRKTFSRQGLSIPYRRDYLERLIQAAHVNDAGACLAAVDKTERVHAATLLIWDPKRTYYLVSGGDPDLRSSGAQSLLLWHSIQLASTRSTVFDFEGSVLEGVERVFRAFGARQVPYHRIMKFPLWLHTYLLASKRI